MKRPFIPFLAFLILLLLTIPFSFDFATSAVPGWHTTVFPPYFVVVFITVIILLLATIGFWLLTKRNGKINWTVFLIYFTLTIPSIFFLKFPTIFLDVQPGIQEEFIKSMEFRMKLIPIAWVLFIIGQVLFLIYFIRIFRVSRIKK